MRRLALLIAALAVVLGVVALATAATTKATLTAAHNAQLGKTIVVSGSGQTVYALKPETTRHLLCTAKACFSFWPPVTVAAKTKLKAGPGIAGRLGVLRRSDGRLQVTLAGSPLYRFALDHSVKGSAHGQGVRSFHGTWHVITGRSSGSANTPPSTSSTSSTASPSSSTSTTSSYPSNPGY